MANIFEFLSKDGNITLEKARKSRQMQFHDKTAYVWGLCYRWDPSLSMIPVRRFAHFMPPCLMLMIFFALGIFQNKQFNWNENLQGHNKESCVSLKKTYFCCSIQLDATVYMIKDKDSENLSEKWFSLYVFVMSNECSKYCSINNERFV